MPYCAVPGCTNGTNATNSKTKDCRFHRLPADATQAARWWQAIKREADMMAVKDARVCSQHFSPDCFTSSGRLHPGSIPSLLVPNHPPKDQSLGEARGSRATQRQRTSVSDIQQSSDQRTAAAGSACQRCEELERENARLKLELALAKGLPDALPTCAKVFTPQQVQCLITGRRPRQWEEETVLKALTIRVRTTRANYTWLREVLGLPLPGLTALQSWLSELELRPNLWDQQMKMLERMLEPLDDRERSCVLMMDEMDVMGMASYDQQGDQVLGPYKHLQVYLAGGLFKAWKLPVTYAFDEAVKLSGLTQLIAAMEGAGARVVAIVSDMGGSNQGLWRQLQISYDGKTSFPNPADQNRRVWVLADAPHLLKCLRNNILDGGITTSGKGVLDRALMRDVVAVDGASEYRLLYKIGLSTHVEVSGMARQRVRPAAQLISASTAAVLDRYIPGKTEEARVIRVMDAMFDVLNAIYPGDVKPLRRGFRGSQDQEEALSAALEECLLMRVGKASHLYAFQKGMVVTIRSIRGLLSDLRQLFGDVYILTRRANQDRLESFFSMVRARGGSSLNPTPTVAKSRLRLLTLLFAMKDGVNPLRLSKDGEGEEKLEGDEVQKQLETIEEEERAGRDERLAADLEEFAKVEIDDDVEELLQEWEGRSAAAPQPSGSRDLETGVGATESAMAYVAGYVAKKAAPEGGQGAYSASGLDGPLRNLWTRLRSQHSLTLPTEEMWKMFTEMEAVFCAHHALERDQLSRDRGVIASLRAALESKLPHIPATMRASFARVRTFIRMGRINASRRDESQARRAARKRRFFAQ